MQRQIDTEAERYRGGEIQRQRDTERHFPNWLRGRQKDRGTETDRQGKREIEKDKDRQAKTVRETGTKREGDKQKLRKVKE